MLDPIPRALVCVLQALWSLTPKNIKSTCKKERFTAHYETWDQSYIDHAICGHVANA
jgi:hypothetical protein